MSISYCLREVGIEEAYEKFNKELQGVHDQCLEILSNMTVDPNFQDIKDEIVCRFKDLYLFAEREPYIKTYDIGSSTDLSFFWMDYIGFDSVDSVKGFLKEHPNFAIFNDSGEQVSLLEFEDIVASGVKKQIGIYSGKEICSKLSLDDQIQDSLKKKKGFLGRVFKKQLECER